ncbi:linalool dehydratase/isomerase domain-containing protein [[Mycobacterium] vasticus]|uniref:Linalool dehydratase/isomerase domain-containing protein n=1 Tax=[Mycobacterium] vasticus TaxID=2875777 RepID=A0ABU5YZV4_9MYCO|nr:hypothetical protein [Mycolicibacter sp. MYC017]MEB3070653.1 hypothetical protein [Mycolicibacter sp. MYC017]
MSSVIADPMCESGLDSHDLPQRSRLNGPVTRRRLRRTLMCYLSVALLGLAPTALGWSTTWQAAGLGLVVPGGGFLVFGWWALAGLAVTLAVLAVSFVLWFATGNVIAPLASWLGAAALASALAVGRDVPAPRFGPAAVVVSIAASIAALTIVSRVIAKHRATRLRLERTAYLPDELGALQRRVIAPDTELRELDDVELGHVRWLLGLGLQPVDKFDGFDIIEQFQPSALRYQLNHVQYALAQVQRHYTPSFHGYLSTAQERLIEKLTLPKVWSYWRLERLWGRLSTDYDPAARENIMLTGWSGICLNTFRATTGSNRFVGPESLLFSLGNPKKSYRHDTHSFQASLMRNFADSPQTVFACEPNWTYSACNIYGLLSVASYDAAFGTTQLDEVAQPFLRGLRAELMNMAGTPVGFRSDYTGIGFPAGTELMFVLAAGWVAPVFPQLARTLWAIACREIFKTNDGGLADYLAKPFMLDSGNYRSTGLPFRAMTLLTARELGDLEVADAAQRALDRFNDPIEVQGQRRFQRGSTYANALATQALLTRPGDWTSLITTSPPAGVRTGPLLEDVPFEAAMVAQAISDGTDLRLVLRAAPAHQPGDAVRLTLSRLRPRSPYTADADGVRLEFNTDDAGRAALPIPVRHRTTVRIAPTP